MFFLIPNSPKNDSNDGSVTVVKKNTSRGVFLERTLRVNIKPKCENCGDFFAFKEMLAARCNISMLEVMRSGIVWQNQTITPDDFIRRIEGMFSIDQRIFDAQRMFVRDNSGNQVFEPQTITVVRKL